MADLAATYTLSTPSGSVRINDSTAQNGLWIDADGGIEGLDDPDVRSTKKPSPQTDGQYVGPAYLQGYVVMFSGLVVVTQYDPYSECALYRAAQQTIVDDLRTKLRAILRTDGTLTWNSSTLSGVRYDLRLAMSGDLLKYRFQFGIATETSAIT